MSASGGPLLLLKNVLFTVLVPGTVGGYLPLWLRGDAAAAEGAWRWTAAAAFATGGAIYLWCVWDFATFGRGTPAPIDAPRRLVARGLYRLTRNPMYVGVLTAIAGHVLLFRSARLLGYLASVALAFHLMVTLYEEKALRRAFGAEYDDYCRRVRRWPWWR